MDSGMEGKLCSGGSGGLGGQAIIVQEPETPLHVALPADDGKRGGETLDKEGWRKHGNTETRDE